MPMNLQTAAQLIHDVLGRTPPAAWPYESIASLAWQTFLDAQDWRWAAGSRVRISTVAGQARYALPADLGHIIVVSGPETWIDPVRLTSWTQLEQFRAAGYVNPQGQPPFFGAVRWTAQTDGSFLPELELYPEPSTSITDAFEVSYLPGSGPPPGNNDDLVFAYPPYIHPLWVLWLREVTLGLIEHDVAGVDARLAALREGTVMAAVVKRDAGAIRRRPSPPGAAAESHRPSNNRRWYARP